jgi:uncharacterized membrane protein
MSRARYVAQAGVIAAVYAAATILATSTLGMFSWGLFQLRISEAVTVVAFFTPAAIPGLWLGSVIANLANLGQTGALGWLDVILGSLGTLLGAWWMWRFRRSTAVGLAGPVIFNALIVPAYLPLLLKGFGLYNLPLLGVDLEGRWLPMYLFGVVAVGIGEAIVMYGLGLPLLIALRRLGIARMVDPDEA